MKSLQASPDGLFFSVVSNESIAIWSMADVEEAFAKSENDLMCKLAPTRDIKQSQRVLCSTVTVLKDPQQKVKVKKVKKDKK